MTREYYLIYRVYNHEERPDERTNSWIYGWTSSKSVLKIFLKQRDKKKYLVLKMDREEIAERFSENDLPSNKMINFLRLRSSQGHEEFCLFTTLEEMQESEIKIQRLLTDLCHIDRIDRDRILFYTNMILHLIDYYMDALHYIGYRPLEIEGIFGSGFDGYTVYDQIDIAYDGIENPREYDNDPGITVPGLSVIDDVANKILYSIESFIRVMRDDL